MGPGLLLFIHGLGGHRVKTWGRFPQLVAADPKLRVNWRVGFYSFPTGFFGLPGRGAPRVQLLAHGLKTEIDVRHSGAECIALVCHSLGGVVARRYVLDQVKQNAPLRVSDLLLFATPNDGAALASIGRFVSPWNRQLRQLARDADLLNDLNADWRALDVDSRVRTHCVVGGLDAVVSTSSAQSFWGPDRVSVDIHSGHRGIVKPVSPGSLPFQILRAQLLAPRPAERDECVPIAPPRSIAPPRPLTSQRPDAAGGVALSRLRALLEDVRLSDHERRLGRIYEANIGHILEHLASDPKGLQLAERNLLREQIERVQQWVERQQRGFGPPELTDQQGGGTR